MKKSREVLDTEAAEELEHIFKACGKDKEVLHGRADDILSDLLLKLGCKKTVDKYKELSEHFWYA